VGQLARLASFPHSGDLILLGAWNDDGEVVCFEEQWASHGGLGGPQDYPFMLYPARLDWDLAGVGNARELHRYFVTTYGLAGQETPDEGARQL
jgi:putative membrane protein